MELSIIIPLYNCEKYIGECLESILKGKKEIDLEIILVDDGSVDGSEKVYNQYSSQIKIIKNSNHGVSYSRNIGFDSSSKKYIMYVDSDDVLSDDWWKIIKENFNADSDINLYDINLSKNQNLIKSCLALEENNSHCSSPVSKIYKKSFLKNNNLRFNEKLFNGEDMLYNLQAYLLTDKITIINKSIYYYRFNIGSITKSFNKKLFENDKEFQERLSEICKFTSKISENMKEDIIFGCKINAFFMFIDRITYLETYNDIKKNLKLLNCENYKINFNYFKKLKFLKKIIYILFKCRLYFILTMIYKIKKVIRNKKQKNFQTFSKI